MSRNKGTFNFAANFEVLTKAPLDARQVVSSFSDLTNPLTWKDDNNNVWLYKGILVSVTGDASTSLNGVYFLSDETTYTDSSTWLKLGSNGGVNIGKNFYTQIFGNDSSTYFNIEHGLNTNNHSVTIYDNNDYEVFADIKRGINTDYIEFFRPPAITEAYNIIIMGF